METQRANREPAALSLTRVVLASVLWLLLVALGVLAGVLIGGDRSCSEVAWCQQRQVTGGTTGAAVGAALAGVVGWRMGLRWWWGLVAVGVAVAAVSLTVVVGFAGIVMVAAAPVLASLLSEVVGRPTSAGVRVRRPGVRVWLALAVTVALVVGASLWWDHREDERTVSRLEATGLVPYAPTEVPGVRIKVPMGSAGRLRYLLEMQGRSTLRVQQSGEDVASLCARVEGRTCESAAPGVTVVRHGGQVEAVVLDVPGGVVDLRPTSPSTSGWTEGQLVRLTREFRPTNARWLVDHER